MNVSTTELTNAGTARGRAVAARDRVLGALIFLAEGIGSLKALGLCIP